MCLSVVCKTEALSGDVAAMILTLPFVLATRKLVLCYSHQQWPESPIPPTSQIHKPPPPTSPSVRIKGKDGNSSQDQHKDNHQHLFPRAGH